MLTAVVVHYQTPDETRACLQSLAGIEVVVVDNGSTPPFPGAAVRSERNLGFAGGCNLGIRRALDGGARQILLLNSDAALAPGCVDRLQEVLSRRPDVGIVGPAVLRRGPPPVVESMGVRFSRRTGRMINLHAGKEPRPAGLLEVEAVTGCCALIRREVFERAGLFAEELFYGFEDLDLCLRAAQAGWRTVCQPAATVWHLGARTIGADSPRRLYFATRNHLRVANSAAPLDPASGAARSLFIIGYNLLHALFTSPAPRLAGLKAVAQGVRDHYRRRYFDPI